MTKNHHVRPALTAIAAVLALSATPLSAQETVPETDTTVTATAPAAEPVSSTPGEAPPAPAADPLAPAETAPVAKTTTTPAKRSATRSAASARSAPARVAPAPVASAPAVESATPVEPVVAPTPEALAAAPMTPEVAPPVETSDTEISADNMLPIAGAAGLGIVALAGFGMAMRRRRKDAHIVQDEWHEPIMARPTAPAAKPVAAKPVVATSGTILATPASARPAFAWGNMAPAAAAPVAANAAPIGARNESRIAAAYRGPTPDNPFLSLKKRLRRAAFFDQRERAVRAGHAAPVSPMAGLPKALTEQVRATMAPTPTRVLQPA